jgi:protoporphyrinogen/coproporphyrinogen III oxidase
MLPSPTASASSKTLIIGGGISGLACAWRLRQLGLPVLLLERGRRFGGVIETVEQDGFRFDVGPQSFTGTPALSELIDELGLGGELLRADPRAPRYILKHGRLVPAPLSPPQLLLTPLLGFGTKLRIISEPFRHTRPPDADESVAAFVRRKFGADLLANLVAPFVSGVWAGDPEKLSLASAFPSLRRLEERYGSVIRGVMKQRREAAGIRPSLCNFRGGQSELVAALAARLGDSALTGAEIATIRRSPGANAQTFELTYKLGGATQSLSIRALVLATPAHETAQLLHDVDAGFKDPLGKIEYAAVAQVSAGYRLEQIKYRNADTGLRGFGFLVPRSEGLRLLGTVWNSSLFPGRTPQGMASFTSFLGGMTDPEMASYSPERIAAIAHSELSSVLGIGGAPVTQHVARWPRALPQYNIGHQGVTSALRNLCARTPGLFLAGNYLAGPSIGACVEHANEVAGNVARFWSATAS